MALLEQPSRYVTKSFNHLLSRKMDALSWATRAATFISKGSINKIIEAYEKTEVPLDAPQKVFEYSL